MELTSEKRAELLDRIRDGKKVKINWLTTVCMVSFEDILEVADEYKLLIDDDEFIYAPEEDGLRNKMNEEIDKTEKEELLDYLHQPTCLEQELKHEEIINLESIFNSDGFKFKRNRKGIILHDILTIDNIGIRVKNGESTLCNIKWFDMKNIKLTSQTEKEYTKKKDYTEYKARASISLAYILDGRRKSLNAANYMGDLNATKVVTSIKTINSILISSDKQKDILLNTAGFKLTRKIPFPKELDSLLYILEHFFHKMKRDQLIQNPK